METDSPAAKAIAAMRRGMLWIAAGTGVTLFTYLRASAGQRYFFMWGLLALGLFEMVYGYVRGRGVTDANDRARLRSATALCLAVLAIAAIAGGSAWYYRAPFWSAVRDLSRGDDAAARLKTIAERHAAAMESGAAGAAALRSWKTSAEGALPLRSDFAAAAQAARYLETAATGTLKERAEIDAKFYDICLEWVDLYASISRTIAQESMAEPPEEWTDRQNGLVDRIEALPPLPTEGS